MGRDVVAATMSVSLAPAPRPMCPHCRNPLDPTRDVLWENTGSALSVRGVTIVYCGWCGAVLGSAPFQTLTKSRRG